MNQESIEVVKPTEIEIKIWEQLALKKTGGLVRNEAFVFKDVLDWPEWYRKPSKLDPDDWENKLLAGCRGEWFAHVVEGRKRVLDVGCGFGFPSFYLARYGHEVVGIDPSSSEIATARAIAERLDQPDNIEFKVIEQNTLLFEDDSFDAATLSTSLECMSDPEALLKELKRVLRPGSPIAIEEEDRSLEPNTHPVWEKTYWAFFDNAVWLWYELRVSDPYLDRRYMLRIDVDSEIAAKLRKYQPYTESKSQGLPVIPFDDGYISWDDALAAVVESTWSQARGFDGPSLKALLESAGLVNVRFFVKPDGKRFAQALAQQGLLETVPDDVRGILRALVKAVVLSAQPVSAMVSCKTPGGDDE